MDARKHLRGLGWKGEGHAIGKNSNGLKKPLLITHKHGNHGLGAKSQREKQADQWWLNAFDNALKDIGSGKESSLHKIQDKGVGRGGLYGFFVRGQSLEGTFDNGDNEESTGTSTPTNSQMLESTTVILSVADLQTSADRERLKEKQRSKKDKKQKKDKKRKRQAEDPVDSHQDEPEAKASKKTAADAEPVTMGKVKKSKTRHSEKICHEAEAGDLADEIARSEEAAIIDIPATETVKAQKEERRRAKEEKRARKEERRRRKEGEGTQTDKEGKRSKRDDTKVKKSHKVVK